MGLQEVGGAPESGWGSRRWVGLQEVCGLWLQEVGGAWAGSK